MAITPSASILTLQLILKIHAFLSSWSMKLHVSSTLQNALVHFSFLLYNVFANICASRLHSLLFTAEVTCPRLLLAAGLECVLLRGCSLLRLHLLTPSVGAQWHWSWNWCLGSQRRWSLVQFFSEVVSQATCGDPGLQSSPWEVGERRIRHSRPALMT